MRLRYPGVCRSCAAALPAGEWAHYHRNDRAVVCLGCAEPTASASGPAANVSDGGTRREATEEADVDAGKAGASARREYERRAAKRENDVRARHPKIGGFLLAMTEEPQSTRAWALGAVGEERLGVRLDQLRDRVCWHCTIAASREREATSTTSWCHLRASS